VKLNERGVIADWLLKLIAGIAIAGVILFDGGSVLVNFFTLDSTADEITTSITLALADDEIEPTQRDLELKAEELAAEAQVKLVRAKLDPDGHFRIKLRRTASTVVVGKIGPIEDWAKATADAEVATS
jgi:hypothetical protein